MPPTKKRSRSPEGQIGSGVRPTDSNSAQVPPTKRRCRAPKDKRVVKLQKLRKGLNLLDLSRSLPSSSSSATPVNQINPTILLQDASIPPLEPPSPHSLLNDVNLYSSDITEMSPNLPHLPTPSHRSPRSGLRDNRVAHRRARLLDNPRSWSNKREKQAATWKSAVLPRIMPVYLANRMTTKSGRLPSPPLVVNPCGCKTTELELNLMSWDCAFLLPHLRVVINSY
jgi:hypothetical protein